MTLDGKCWRLPPPSLPRLASLVLPCNAPTGLLQFTSSPHRRTTVRRVTFYAELGRQWRGYVDSQQHFYFFSARSASNITFSRYPTTTNKPLRPRGKLFTRSLTTMYLSKMYDFSKRFLLQSLSVVYHIPLQMIWFALAKLLFWSSISVEQFRR